MAKAKTFKVNNGGGVTLYYGTKILRVEGQIETEDPEAIAALEGSPELQEVKGTTGGTKDSKGSGKKD